MVTRRSFLAGISGLLAQRRSAAQVGQPPDIVFFLTDDMNGTELPVLGPALNYIGGTRYENFTLATSLCTPSRYAILTGRYGHNTGVMTNLPVRRVNFGQMLPVALQQAGYYTGMVGKTMYGQDKWRVRTGWNYCRVFRKNPQQYRQEGGYSTYVIQKWALEFIKKAPKDRPFFLMISLNAPHAPSEVHPKYAKRRVGGANAKDSQRRRAILPVNDLVRNVARAMGPRWDTASVFLCSDNGVLQNGRKAIWLDKVVRVPMIARIPGVAWGVDTRLVSNIDIAPTIIRIAGAEAFVTWEMDGRAIQDSWDRTGVLLEQGKPRPSAVGYEKFFGVKCRDGTFVLHHPVKVTVVGGKRRKKRRNKKKNKKNQVRRNYRYLPRWRRLWIPNGEKANRITSLPSSKREGLEQQLAQFRNCSGDTCREADLLTVA